MVNRELRLSQHSQHTVDLRTHHRCAAEIHKLLGIRWSAMVRSAHHWLSGWWYQLNSVLFHKPNRKSLLKRPREILGESVSLLGEFSISFNNLNSQSVSFSSTLDRRPDRVNKKSIAASIGFFRKDFCNQELHWVTHWTANSCSTERLSNAASKEAQKFCSKNQIITYSRSAVVEFGQSRSCS